MFNSFCPYFLLTVKYEIEQQFHIKTFVYRIKTLAGNYIAHFEEYTNDVYVVKFYPASLKRNDKKYHLVINSKVMPEVVGTILKIMLHHLNLNHQASFGFVASHSIIGKFAENKGNNQRFRIYKKIMHNFFGKEIFAHFRDESTSAYLMINRLKNIPVLMPFLKDNFIDLYPGLFDIEFQEFP